MKSLDSELFHIPSETMGTLFPTGVKSSMLFHLKANQYVVYQL